VTTVLQSTIGGLYRGREYFLLTATFGVVGMVSSILFPVLAAITLSPSVHNLVMATLASRLVTLIPSLIVAHYAILRSARPVVSSSAGRQLLGYGSWMSFAGVIELVISSADRFVVGIIAGSAIVPFYTIPFGIVSRSMIFPNSLMAAVMPQMVARGSSDELQGKSLEILLLLTPLFIIGIAVSPEFLTLWMGPVFAGHATLPLQILGAAFWIETIAIILYFRILADGNPKKNFIVSTATALPYFAILFLFTKQWGITGTCFAYLAKNMIYFVFRMTATQSIAAVLRRIWVDALLVSTALAIACAGISQEIRLLSMAGLLAICILLKFKQFSASLLTIFREVSPQLRAGRSRR
jgi:O-antigen/teichoic acid export membrane protein